MASAETFVCSRCHHEIVAWSDGNPYYFDDAGKKVYAYHPDHEGLDRCVGNDSPWYCLSCGHEFLVDSREPHRECRKCGSDKSCPTTKLAHKRCPLCREGEFEVDPTQNMIS